MKSNATLETSCGGKLFLEALKINRHYAQKKVRDVWQDRRDLSKIGDIRSELPLKNNRCFQKY